MKKSVLFSGTAVLVFVIIQGFSALSLTGCEGPAGPMGPQGLKGDKGDPGADGVSILWMGELGSAPAGAKENWAYYNTATGNAYLYDGRSWRLMARDGIAGSNGVSIAWQGEGTSHPAGPQLNWAYYNSADNKSYIWDGSAWQVLAKDGEVGPQGLKGDKGDAGADGVSVFWQGERASHPASPQLNWAYYNSADKIAFIWDGSAWMVLSQDGSNGVNGVDGADGVSMSWKGELASPPESPQLNWAYYSSADKKSYIWNGSAWQVLAQDGEIGPQGLKGDKGDTGADGVSIAWQGESSSPPASPQLNWAYYNSADKKAYIWDGSAWQILAQDGEEGSVTGAVSMTWKGEMASPPASPELNWAYYSSADKVSYIWDGSAWQVLAKDGEIGSQGPKGDKGDKGDTGADGVSITWQGESASHPASPQLNWAYYNSADKKAYVWNGSAWQILAQDGVNGADGTDGSNGANGVSINWRGEFASPPASPQLNWAYYNSADKISYVYNGSAWQVLVKDGEVGPQGPKGDKGDKGDTGADGVSILWQGERTSPPASPQLNWAYYNSADKKAYVWNGSAWQILAQDGANGADGANGSDGTNGVSISWRGEFASPPASPQLNWAYYNSADKVSYIYNGSAWQVLAKDGEAGPQGPKGDNGDGVYLVTFRANGGTFLNGSDIFVLPVSAGTIEGPGVMTRPGYTFDAWYKDAAFTNPWNFASDSVSGHITLYAKWIQNVYTVSFDAAGGSPVPSNQIIVEGQNASSPAAMGKSGYTFAGWYRDALFTELWDFGVDTVYENLTLYAKWNKNQNTVTYYADGGLPEPAQIQVNYGVTLTQPATVSKPGYTFGGWYKDEFFAEQWNFASDTVTGDIILYAKWGYLVTFNANGGTPAPAQQVVITGGKISEPPAISYGSRAFGGWFKEVACINPWNFTSDTVTGNVNLYALWDYAFLITDIADVVPYLTSQTTVPVHLPMAIDLGTMTSSSSGWQDLLGAIEAANKYVDLDLTKCTMDGAVFNPDSTVTTGKILITSIILPEAAASIANGTSSDPTFNNFTRLKSVVAVNVTVIGHSAFYQNLTLESVDFPAATNTGVSTFYRCTSLVSINFPVVTSIEGYAFDGCSGLKSVSFPAATSIGGSAFYQCTGLTSVDFPSVITIGNSFYYCIGLTSVEFPAAISIGLAAFVSCTGLTSVDFPVATSIGYSAFSNCNKLTSVEFPKVTTIDNSVSTTSGAFNNCSSLVTANFPAATSIGNNAFSGCSLLASVNIPEVMSIGNEVFRDTGTGSLTVTVGGIAPTVGTNSFTSVASTKTVTVKVPAGWSGYDAVPSTYSGTSSTNNWGNAFRGLGWNGLAYQSGTVNQYITLDIQQQ